MKITDINSIGIRKSFGSQEVEIIGSTGDGDARLTLYRAEDGREAIETNGDPIFENESGFDQLRSEIVGS